MTQDMMLSRRRLLQGGAAIAGLATAPALAKGPMLGTQAPYFYRFKLGNAEATIVSDGPLPLGDPHKNFNGLAAAEMDKQLTDNFLPLDNALLEQNILVLNTGDRMVLFDTGMGGLKIFGPTTGKMMATLKQAGIEQHQAVAGVHHQRVLLQQGIIERQEIIGELLVHLSRSKAEEVLVRVAERKRPIGNYRRLKGAYVKAIEWRCLAIEFGRLSEAWVYGRERPGSGGSDQQVPTG